MTAPPRGRRPLVLAGLALSLLGLGVWVALHDDGAPSTEQARPEPSAAGGSPPTGTRPSLVSPPSSESGSRAGESAAAPLVGEPSERSAELLRRLSARLTPLLLDPADPHSELDRSRWERTVRTQARLVDEGTHQALIELLCAPDVTDQRAVVALELLRQAGAEELPEAALRAGRSVVFSAAAPPYLRSAGAAAVAALGTSGDRANLFAQLDPAATLDERDRTRALWALRSAPSADTLARSLDALEVGGAQESLLALMGDLAPAASERADLRERAARVLSAISSDHERSLNERRRALVNLRRMAPDQAGRHGRSLAEDTRTPSELLGPAAAAWATGLDRAEREALLADESIPERARAALRAAPLLAR